jgi:hypothetical protein
MTNGRFGAWTSTPSAGPWFRRQPHLAVAVAAAMTFLIFAARLSVAGTADAITVFYALPVALIAVAFGFRWGLAAGAGAVALIEVWVGIEGITLSPLAWTTRTIPMLLLGGLLGLACDRLQEAYERDEQLSMMIAFQREAAEINDTVVQGLAAAKWLFEMGDLEHGLNMLTDTMVQAQDLVTSMLGHDSPLPGDLSRSHPATPSSRHHAAA